MASKRDLLIASYSHIVVGGMNLRLINFNKISVKFSAAKKNKIRAEEGGRSHSHMRWQ